MNNTPAVNQNPINTNNPEESRSLLSRLQDKKIILCVLAGVVLLLLVVISLFTPKVSQEQSSSTVNNRTGNNTTGTSQSGNTSALVDTKINTNPPPAVNFDSYENKSALPAVPPNVNVYTLKADYTLDDVVAFGKKLGLTDYKTPDTNRVIVYNSKDVNNAGLMIFDRSSGVFAFQSYGNHKPKDGGTSPALVASRYISEIGLSDPTISCNITYQRQDEPDLTFVECHRDWAKTQLPILNFVGLMNMGEDKKLDNLALGQTGKDGPNDPSIINTSNGQDGKRRPNDFNTITVAVASNGNIFSIASNIRQITETASVPYSNLFTPDGSIRKFQSHEASLSFTSPVGVGSPNFAKVYPENKAFADKATIIDHSLVYLESPPGAKQTALVPAYLIRGTALLSSGYNVRFLQAIPAVLPAKLAELVPQEATVMPTASLVVSPTRGIGGIKLGTMPTPTYTPTPTLAPSPIPTTPPTATIIPTVLPTLTSVPPTSVPPTFAPSATIAPNIPTATSAPPAPTTPPSTDICVPALDELDPVYIINGIKYGYMAVLNSRNGYYQYGHYVSGHEWYYIPEYYGKISTYSEMMGIQSSILNDLASKGITYSYGIQINQLYGGYDQMAIICPLRITGDSPSLFVYGPKGARVSVLPDFDLTYADPGLMISRWQLAVGDSGQFVVNNTVRDYLYYEYKPVKFDKPEKGWTVEKDKLSDFAKYISSQLLLNQKETERLLFELNFSASEIDDSNLFIGLIDQDEVNKKLPLNISPIPDASLRFHFYISRWDNKEYQIPTLKPIIRSSYMTLELGSYTPEK